MKLRTTMLITLNILEDTEQLQVILHYAQTIARTLPINQGILWWDLFHKAVKALFNQDETSSTLKQMRFAQLMVWEQLHQGVWHQVHPGWRNCYHCTNIITAALLYNTSTDSTIRGRVALYELDLALIMGGPLSNNDLNINPMIETLVKDIQFQTVMSKDVELELRPRKRQRVESATGGESEIVVESQKQDTIETHLTKTPSTATLFHTLPALANGLQRGDLLLSEILVLLQPPSMNTFKRDIFDPKIPHLMQGVVNQWPAYKKWNLEYLLTVAGPRTVPIEIGKNYMATEWTQKLMTLEKFVYTYVVQEEDEEQEDEKSGKSDTNAKGNHHCMNEKPIAYLAQHELFDQITILSKDIMEPDYCIFSDNKNSQDSPEDASSFPKVQRNSWFGPSGTVSPLHHDRYHNLFCQVFGSKTILLIDPKYSHLCYPNDGIQCNTSRIDFQNDGWIDRWPKAKGLHCSIVHVKAGEMLYIPPGWWHFCVAEEISFSVSYWWGGPG